MAPGPQDHRAILELNRRPLRQCNQVLLDVPLRGRFALPARLIEALREVALPVQERDADHRHAGIGT
jgi:hypothetical protein